MKWRNLGYFLFTLILPFNKTWGFRVFINMILFKLYEPMKNHLSFACGGEAKFFTEPKTIDEFTKTIALGSITLTDEITHKGNEV